jgi:hypothetical protein
LTGQGLGYLELAHVEAGKRSDGRSSRRSSASAGKEARMDERRGGGIATLRDRRGNEKVTFDDVADHLEDHLRRWPGDGPAIDRLAAFLAGVEDVPHDHRGRAPTRGDDRTHDAPV